MIISLVNLKGGVGKTTVAINLAASMSRRTRNLILVDADPQGSATQWHSIEENLAFDVKYHPRPISHEEIQSLSRDYEYVLIDTAPAIWGITESVLKITDVAIVPVGPSPLDIWSSAMTVRTIEKEKAQRDHFEGRILISKKIIGTRLGREARQAIEAFDMPIFRTELCQRIAYIEAMLSGVSVLQYVPQSKAAHEIQGLCEEVMEELAAAEIHHPSEIRRREVV